MPTIAVHDDAGDYELSSHSEIDLAGDTIDHPHAPPDVFTHDVGGLVPRFTDGDYAPTDGAGEHDRGDGTVRNTAVPTEHTDDISLFKEAIEQLELAEQRESEALRELENALRRTEELEAAIALEQKARREAEQGRTDAEQLHADALRAVATADYCPACQGFKRYSLSDPQVTQWLEENAETVWLVAGRDDAAIAALGITVFPTTILDVGGGYSLASITGSVQPWILVEQLTVARDRTRQEFCPPGMF